MPLGAVAHRRDSALVRKAGGRGVPLNLYLMRHCLSVPGARDDAERPLTAAGRAQAQEMAVWLAHQIGRVDTVICSSMMRAIETAEIMAEALGSHIQRTPMLDPDVKPDEAWKHVEAIAGFSAEVLVVSHHPLVGHLIDQLGSVGGISHIFEHGAIALVDTYSKEMSWLVNPDLVARDEDMDDAIAEMAEASAAVAESLELREDWVTIDGAHVFINDLGVVTQGPAHLIGMTHKAALARANYSGGDKHQQDIAEKMENHLATELGMKKSANNKPFDLFGSKYAVEVKTLVSNTNDKITMNKSAIARKDAFVKETGLKPYTVVVDARGTEPKYFVRAGYGSFRIGSMTPASTASGIRSIMRAAA